MNKHQHSCAPDLQSPINPFVSAVPEVGLATSLTYYYCYTLSTKLDLVTNEVLTIVFEFRDFIALGYPFADIDVVNSIKPIVYRLTDKQFRPPRPISIFSAASSRDRRYRARSISIGEYDFPPKWAIDKSAVRRAIKDFSTSITLLFGPVSVGTILDRRPDTLLSPLTDR